MPKVYVVSTGEYSDWSIAGIYDAKHKEEAEEEMLNLGDYVNDLEEYELNKPVNPREGWHVTYTPNTGIWKAYRDDLYKMNEVQTSRYGQGNEYIHYYVHIKAKNREAALKIGNEKISQYIANRGSKTDDEIELADLEKELSKATAGSYVAVATFKRYNELKYKKEEEKKNGESNGSRA